jgi:hypothetical protein
MYNVKSMLIVAIASVSLMACSQTKSNDKGVVAEQQASKTSQSSVSQEDAQKILSNYLKIKNALVKTDGEAASSTAKNMLGLLTSI